MDKNAEYHDPDYPEVPFSVKAEPPSVSEEEKVGKIKDIIRREFLNEIEIRGNEVKLIDQRMRRSRRLLHRMRYSIVNSYYKEQKLQLTKGQVLDDIAAQNEPKRRAEVTSLLREGQRRIHPSVRKLLGKKTVDLSEILKTRGPRNKTRKDYSAMLQKRNYTISADMTKTLRPDKKPSVAPMAAPEEPCCSRPAPVLRQSELKVSNIMTLDEVTRNKMKYRYRIVIGNTSKYAPPSSRVDRSTHKWLLYVRGPPHAPDISPIVTAVTVRLHHSYAPHQIVHINTPPFHISRRGWGEFPAKIELHFTLPERNRPTTVEHNIKLDRNYTGMQTLGSETLVDVWLYSTQEMLQYEFKEDMQIEPQETPLAPDPEQSQPSPNPYLDSYAENTEVQDTHPDKYWMDFFAKGPSQVDVDEMFIKPIKKEPTEEKDLDNMIESNVIQKNPTENAENNEVSVKTEKDWTDEYKSIDNSDIPNEILNQPTSLKKRIVKYIDPTTGKIYYLEMDRTLDLTKVQEIVINNKATKITPIKSNGLKSVRKKRGVSLLKPQVKSTMRPTETSTGSKIDFSHIENDHCYLATPRRHQRGYVTNIEIKKEKTLYSCLCSSIGRLNSVRAAVNFLIKRIPLVSSEARDSDFLRHFSFVVETEEKYWKLDFAKRRNIEWSRAKLINKILSEHFMQSESIWRTKQILYYSRLHGYYPIRQEALLARPDTNEWSSWDDLGNSRTQESNIKELYTSSEINTLSIFDVKKLEANISDVIDLAGDEDLDIISCDVKRPQVKKETAADVSALESLPVESDDDRLRFLFIEKKCSDIGLELKNEDVGNGYSYSATHAVLLASMKSFADELIRSALAAKMTRNANTSTPTVWAGASTSRPAVNLEDVLGGVSTNPRLRLLSRAGLATTVKDTHAI